MAPAKEGNIETILWYLMVKRPVESQISEALLVASKYGHIDVVKQLFNTRAMMNTVCVPL